MKPIYILIFFAFSSLYGFAQTRTDSTDNTGPSPFDFGIYENTSLIELIANPEKYDGKMVQVAGYMHLEFEGNAVYLHREDFENMICENSIWLRFSKKLTDRKDIMNYNNNYVIIIGTFKMNDKGHMGMFSGTLDDVVRLDFKYVREDASAQLLPQFPGGKQKFVEYFHKSIKYPLVCQQKNQQGKVSCNFDVYRDGHIGNVRIAQKASAEMNKEVLRVINEMPRWTPVPVSLLSPAFSQYTVTVIFRLNGTEYGKGTSENEIIVVGYGTSEKPVITK